MLRNRNNRSLALTSSRVATRSRRRQDVFDVGLRTTLVSGPKDPPQVTPDLIIQKRVLIRMSVSSGAGTPLQPSTISAAIIGEVTPGYTIRLLKLSVYGSQGDEDQSITVADTTTDLAVFTDFGTYGAIRPQVHIRPSFELRQRWFGYQDQTPLYDISITSGNVIAIVAATVEVRFAGVKQ